MAIEQTIKGLFDKVAEEAYLFIFKNKVAEPEMEFPDGDDQPGADAAAPIDGKAKRPRKNNQLDLAKEAQKADLKPEENTEAQ
jgi:hypothetical protein